MKTFSPLAILLASFISIILAGDCNNPLLSIFNITSLGTPTEVSDIKYCKSLQSGQSCCSADTINGFQAKADDLANKLKDIVAARDRQIVQTRDQVIPQLQNSLQELRNNSQQALNVLKGKMQPPQNDSGSNPPPEGQQSNNTDPQGPQPSGPINESSPGFSAASSLAQSLGDLSQQVVDDLPSIKGNFTAFQKSRSTCVIQMVKLQAAAWCLSCDPNYGSKGVSGSDNVQLSNNVCGRLQGSCFDFISQSSQQSAILSIKNLAPKIGAMSAGLQMIINDNSTGLTELNDAVDGADTSNDDAPPVGVPPNCTSDDCPWICTDLFKGGQLNQTLVSAGGEPTSIGDDSEGDGSSRILLEEGTVVKTKLMKRRALETSEWNPDEDEAGVTVTFADDPAGVNTDDTSNAGGLIQASLMGLFALIAIFMI